MSSSSSKPEPDVGSLDWLKLRQELNERDNRKPTGWPKLRDKMLENPFVPLGTIGTAMAIVMGLRSIAKGNQKMSQLMMRMRVGCQAFAITACIVGLELKRRSEVAEYKKEQTAAEGGVSQLEK